MCINVTFFYPCFRFAHNPVVRLLPLWGLPDARQAVNSVYFTDPPLIVSLLQTSNFVISVSLAYLFMLGPCLILKIFLKSLPG